MLIDHVEVRGDAEPVCVDEEMQGGKEIPEFIQNSRQEMFKATVSKLGTIVLYNMGKQNPNYNGQL